MTKDTVRQLEKRLDRITDTDKPPWVVRHVSVDDRLVDSEGYVLNAHEVQRIEQENEEIEHKKGMIICLTRYCDPKIR